MAARVSALGGSIDTSRMMWSEIYESAQDPRVRKMALKELEGLTAQSDEQQLDQLAAEYQKRFGRYPTSTGELRAAGLGRGIPLDPEGYPYIFGANGKSSLNPQSPIVIPAPPQVPGASK